MSKEYLQKFKDPRWQKKRLEILERDKFTCYICGDKENQLHVHHTIYFEGENPWDYGDRHLITLCDYCHKIEHDTLYDSLKSLSYTFRNMGFTGNDIDTVNENIARIQAIDLFKHNFLNVIRRFGDDL